MTSDSRWQVLHTPFQLGPYVLRKELDGAGGERGYLDYPALEPALAR